MSAGLGVGSVGVVGERRILSQSKLSKSSNERPLMALAVQSECILSSRMDLTGVFWRMRQSNVVPLKKACILKLSRLRSRFAGFLHKSCSINKKINTAFHSDSERLMVQTSNINKPQWAVRSEQSWRLLGCCRENPWLCLTWCCGQAPQELGTAIGEFQWPTQKHIALFKAEFMSPYLSRHKWEQQNAKRPPVGSVIVRTPA